MTEANGKSGAGKSKTKSSAPAKKKAATAKKKASAAKKAAPAKKKTAKATGEAESAPKRRASTGARKRAAKPAVKTETPVETTSAVKPSFLRKLLWPALKIGVITGLLFVAVSSGWIVLYRYVNPPVTPLMILRHLQDEEDVRKRWRDYDEISPEFLLAVVAAEDQLFFKHNGFDLKQIQAAIETRLDGGRLRGGSTISQQVAKNAFLWPGRSWIRKGLEVWFTAGIELCWSKERILEVYVNIAEMGEGIYGVEAAAQHYYQKSADALTRNESALIAAILPAPRDRSPVQPTAYLRERQAWITGQMRNLGGVTYLTN